VGSLLGRVGLGCVCRDWMLHLVSKPTLAVSRARGDQLFGHDVCMRVGPSWTRHGMTHAPAQEHTNVAKRGGSWIKCPERVSRSGIRRGRRILRRGDCNSPKMGPVCQIRGMGRCYYSSGAVDEYCRRELLYIRTPGTIAVQYCSSIL
jgi:hypothetical protein